MSFDSIELWGIKDGNKTLLVELPSKDSIVIPPPVDPPPDNEPDVIIGIVLANILNVRNEPSTGSSSEIMGVLTKGTNITVENKTYYPANNNLEWLRIVKVNGGNEFVGGFVAKQYVDLKESEPNPPKAVSPSLYPVVVKQYETKTHYNATLDGNNTRRQSGGNGRRFMWMVEKNGAVRHPQFVETGANQARLIEELDRLNKPQWTHEPLYGHFIRVYVQCDKFGIEQAVLNGHEFMRVINSYRDQNGLPYIRVIFCMVDTFNSYPNMVFPQYVAAGYHNAPLGKTNAQFWIDRAWESHYMDLVEAFVPEMSNAYPDLIFGWQIMNEAALYPVSDLGIERFIESNQEIAKTIFTLSGKRHHVMTGLRTAADIYQDRMSGQEFYDLLFNAKGNWITAVNAHVYVKQPPLLDDWQNPHNLFDDWKNIYEDVKASWEHERLLMFDEFGSYCDGYPSWHTPRDVIDKYACEYLQWELGGYAKLDWALALTAPYDMGYGDDRGLTRYKSINGQQHEYTSTPGAAGAASKHAKDNYARG